MTDTTTKPATPTAEDMARAIATGEWSPELLAFAAQALQSKAEADAKELDRKKSAIGDEADALVAAIEREEFPIQTWHKRKNGEKTDVVSGVGFHVVTKRTLVVDGRTREVSFTTFVKWNPNGGSAPAEATPGDE